MMAGIRKIIIPMGLLCAALLIFMYGIVGYIGRYANVSKTHIFMVINAIILGFNIGIVIFAIVLKKKQELRFRLSEAKNIHELVKNKEMAAERLHEDAERLKLQLRSELKRAMSIAKTYEAGTDKENVETEWDERYCLNILADTVLKLKVEDCRKRGINIAINANIPMDLKLSETELCSLISNLLDNAIEACEQINTPDISFRAYINKAYLIISATNTASPEYAKQQKRAGRGMGLYIVKGIVEKYNGEITTEFDGERFKAEAVVEAV